jgi:hypothetical protein
MNDRSVPRTALKKVGNLRLLHFRRGNVTKLGWFAFNTDKLQSDAFALRTEMFYAYLVLKTFLNFCRRILWYLFTIFPALLH